MVVVALSRVIYELCEHTKAYRAASCKSHIRQRRSNVYRYVIVRNNPMNTLSQC